jgi:phenylpropionate dioxygenase-like ring-hydroxylating dioxygenase large terminal subunit
MTVTDPTDDRLDEPVGTAITAAGSTTGGPTLIPADRYRSEAFAALEAERLWPSTWHVACSVDHVAEPGDWFEYRIGERSILIVRGDDGVLRAHQNVCRHRGNVLCTGSGSGITELRCGFHRWSWDLEGRLREVPSRKGFGTLRNDDFPLLGASVDSWGRLVFVNPDPDAMPLAEYLQGVPDDIAWADPDSFRCVFTSVTPVDANWKVVADGFSETYHIQGLHPEMLATLDDINSGQHVFGRHSVSKQPYGVPSPRLGRNVPDQDVWDSFILTQGGRMGITESCPVPEVPSGRTVQDVIADHVRSHQAGRGVDLSGYTTDQIMRLNQYNLFPNATVLIDASALAVLVSRPGPTAQQAELVFLHFERVNPGAPRTRPMDVQVPLDQAHFGFVLDQDVELLKVIGIGVRQPGVTHFAVSSEEIRIITMQRNLELQLGIEPSELLGGPSSA